MNQPTDTGQVPEAREPAAGAPTIVAEIFESRRFLKWQWRFRFIGLNGEVIGDDYTTVDNARVSVNLIVKQSTQVHLQIRDRNDNLKHIGRIR